MTESGWLVSQGPTPVDRELHFDRARVWAMEFGALTFRRPAELVRAFDPETYNVFLLLRGGIDRSSDTDEFSYQPHDLHVIDSAQPLELRAHSARVSCVGVEIPKNLLPRPGRRTDRLVGPPIPARHGIGALLAGFLTQVHTDPSSYRPTDGARLGLVATDLVSALFAHVLEEDDREPPEAHRRNLLLRIKAFILRRLHDPDLNPGTVAAAHHISVSYLYRLFQDDNVPVTAWIRRQRLEGARRDLADPALRFLPVHQIAARWGFVHHAAFTRAFRAAYGVVPRDYRTLVA